MSVMWGHRHTDPREAGFTLVELLVVLVLAGVVGTVALNGIVTSTRVSRQTQERVQAAAELQRAAERITRDVRAACPLEVLEGDRIVGIVHPDGGAAMRAIYRYDAPTRALRSATEVPVGPLGTPPETTLMTQVEPVGDLFTYLGEDATVVTAATDVRFVHITLRRDLAEQDPVQVETRVALRNGGRACD